MAVMRWDPFGDFRFPILPMRRAFDMAPWGKEPFWRVFQEDWWPRVDVYSEGKDLVVKAEIPGADPDDISLSLEEGALTVSGKREREEKRRGVNRLFMIIRLGWRQVETSPGLAV